MVGRRKVASRLPHRLYQWKGKRVTSYYTITPKNQRINLGRDLVEAKKKLAALECEVAVPGTIADMIEDYLSSELRPLVAAGKRSPRTLADREEQMPNLVAAFGKMRPQDLTPHQVWTYLHKFRGIEAPVRANKEIAFLQVVYQWAKDQQGTVKENPCAGVKRNEETPRDRLVSDAELSDFMRLAREDGDVSSRAALAFYIAFVCAKGQAQVLRLGRNQLSKEGISFGKRKGGAAVFVEWSDELRAAVEESLAMPAKMTPMWVVHTQEGGPYTSDGFKKGWQMLMTKWCAGGTWADGTERKPGKRFTFHDSRAKGITTTIEQGRKASELSGHRQEATVAKIYDRRAVRISPPAK